MKKQIISVLSAFTIWMIAISLPASSSPSELLGQWYGTWERPELLGSTSNFTMNFMETPYGLLAIMYVPEFGLFDQALPVSIQEDPDGFIIVIGIEGLSVIWGRLDENSIAGSFYADFDGIPPYDYNGIWQAQKYTGQQVFPGAVPGASCNDLPPLYCIGDSAYCSELVQFEPAIGESYVDFPYNSETWENQFRSYIRRDLMILINYATAKITCKTNNWDYGNFEPLTLIDMSEADGSIPGTSIGAPGHPPGTHENGKDIDVAYYQLYSNNNLARPVGVHHENYQEASHLVGPPYALDKWRTALFIAYLAEHPRLRVVGVDGQIGPVLEEAFDELVEMGWLDAGLRESIPLAYETVDTGLGWFYFHHHHIHISMNPLYQIVSDVELQPDTLNRQSKGQFVTAHIEFDELIDPSHVDVNSMALILNGYTMLYAQPEDIRITDYNQNGIDDLTIKFDRQKVLESVDNGTIEIAVTGLIDSMFFQESDVIQIFGKIPPGLIHKKYQHGNLYTPFIRPGGRAHQGEIVRD